MKSQLKKNTVFQSIILLSILVLLFACKNKKETTENDLLVVKNESMPTIPLAKEGVKFDSSQIVKFLEKYPVFKPFKKQFDTVYKANEYKSIWQDEDGIKELTNKLIAKLNKLGEEGVVAKIPHKDSFYEMIQSEQTISEKFASNIDLDLMITGQYFNYVKEVFAGKMSTNLASINWYLPTKKFSYLELLQKNLADSSIKAIGTAVERMPQYAGLKKQLAIYNGLNKQYAVETIIPDLLKRKSLKLNDTGSLIPIMTKRISELGYQIKLDTSKVYSGELVAIVNLIKPRDLAIRVLKQDPNWTEAKIDSAMHQTKETTVTLKNRIPVYIGYFTAFVGNDDNLNFRDDIYSRDNKLFKLRSE